jgi:SAM-dependent methyltransferase
VIHLYDIRVEAHTHSSHGFSDPAYARHWLEETTARSPERSRIIDAFVREVAALNLASTTIIELGSGPGVLAEQLLDRCQIERYWLVDFSREMHALARERLGDEDRANYLLADFRDPDWTRKINGQVDVAVSMQAVHELRHASRTPDLYRQLADVVRPGGSLFVCDHLRLADDNRALFLTVEEHLVALQTGGIVEPCFVLKGENMAYFKGRFPGMNGDSKAH